jgi:subtilisin-like proprotein convertase family protein
VNLCNVNSGSANLQTASLSGFSTAINLTASNFPAGTTVSFSKNPVLPGETTIITLSNTDSLSAGIYNILVTGQAGSVSKTSLISFWASSLPVAPSSLIAPINNAIGLSTLPAFNWSKVVGDALYSLDISTVSNFSTIVQSIPAITTLPYVLTAPLEENTLYFWRVSAYNNCGKGEFSTIGVFKTGIATCKYSTDVPKFISSYGNPGVGSTLTIPAQSGVTISDLNVVGLLGRHSFVNDLTLSLTSPGGTSVILMDTICTNEADFDINFDDEALITVIPCPPTGRQTVRPQQLLAAFNGESSAGIWKLTVKDNYDQDGGDLEAWGLAINGCAFIATPVIIYTEPWKMLCAPAANISLAADLTGSNYQWQVNKGNGFNAVGTDVNFSGVNTDLLQINNAPTSWTGYQYRCLVDGNASKVYTLAFTSVWNGSISDAWENAANWSCNAVPDENTDVVIQSGTVSVNSGAICRSIKANLGSVVTVNPGFTITVTH